jgi:hypothetical protein
MINVFKGEWLSLKGICMYRGPLQKMQKRVCEVTHVEPKRGLATLRIHVTQLPSAHPHINAMGNPHKYL